jgi:hypothetical protein
VLAGREHVELIAVAELVELVGRYISGPTSSSVAPFHISTGMLRSDGIICMFVLAPTVGCARANRSGNCSASLKVPKPPIE